LNMQGIGGLKSGRTTKSSELSDSKPLSELPHLSPGSGRSERFLSLVDIGLRDIMKRMMKCRPFNLF